MKTLRRNVRKPLGCFLAVMVKLAMTLGMPTLTAKVICVSSCHMCPSLQFTKLEMLNMYT